jgi:hypothetical protein
MSEKSDKLDQVDANLAAAVRPPPQLGRIMNLAEPIKLKDVKLTGVSVSAALPGQTVSIAQRMSLTSDDAGFHVIAEGMAGALAHMAAQAGHPCSLRDANRILLVVHDDDSADLWIDTAATSIGIITKRDIPALTPVFSHDVADILSLNFPAIELLETDRVLYIFREAWRFALCFKLDSNPLDVSEFCRALGFLYRNMAFRQFYDAVANENLFKKLIGAGWFPFVEIMPEDVSPLLSHVEAGLPLEIAEAELLAKFDQARMDHILQRWTTKPSFASKKRILESAIRSFCNDDPVACIKTITTEIEGIINNSYRQVHGTGTRKISKLLAFASDMAARRVGGPGTLLFPKEFARYLAEYVYASYDPESAAGSKASRHAFGHGAVDDEGYTKIRALQAVLTLDQLAFYL